MEPLLRPLSKSTRRWIAGLLALSAATVLLTGMGFPPVKIPGVDRAIHGEPQRLILTLAIVVVGVFTFAAAVVDLMEMRRRWYLRSQRANQLAGISNDPRPFRKVLSEASVWPVLGVRVGLPLLAALIALTASLCSTRP